MDTRKSIKERSFLKLHTRNRKLSASIYKGHLLELQKLVFISNSDCCKASYFTNIDIYIIYIHTKHQTFVIYIYIEYLPIYTKTVLYIYSIVSATISSKTNGRLSELRNFLLYPISASIFKLS